MDKLQAIKNAGSAKNLAQLLGITRAAISQWGDTVPQARVWQLKALRPEWFMV
jgi:DNA-binding transcriptional regulator YdaS (Cro superfamily)|tara:strand:+ start:1076 stop:1234 length:159 start_codon:yes stop_codon:yes gene_type:complete